MPDERDIFQICVDTAAAAGLEFLLIGGHPVNARGYERTTLDFDFLIAARDLRPWGSLLEAAGPRDRGVASHCAEDSRHAHREPSRIGKRFYGDILALVRRNRVDTASAEFQEILAHYAAESIQERLHRDLRQRF